ncbi:MAG: pyridoxine 5'-phosphate synthase [Candidatus Omnitrophica bacterium CG_4_10_14_0_2_um_filter_44_9]|nr:MAG: pyridoxine 5'-phosphate synthase [Candidatus Omnitrophica bacterium CG_4_10_14_0_8_um_filter_44_12]PIZ83039.1 MAG: pyridoxine 5'-phosphate synthase [Candidatus Omnitrophica bacterium CG_4_10_14_0_2_um_filter_44_9]
MNARLGVNIDHVATLRQLRHSLFPDVLLAAQICEAAGADSIVAHLREDRRHVQDRDVFALRKIIKTKLNLEMSIAPEIVSIACRLRPDQATLVPENRKELTTEGGLDVVKMAIRVEKAIVKLKASGIEVSLFIEPDRSAIKKARQIGAEIVELHTGSYANAVTKHDKKRELSRLKDAVACARDLGLVVCAGHGLDYRNVPSVARIPHIYEFNIGYAIICRSLFVGLKEAVQKMKRLIG